MIQHIWQTWKRIGRKIGDFQARVLLTLVYFILITPFALVVRWATDPLALKPKTRRGWHARGLPSEDPMTRARRQF